MKIGIFSPSGLAGGISPHRAQNAINFLQYKGHQLILGNLFYADNYYCSGNIKARYTEFNNLLLQNCDMYICSIGGYCANSIINKINYRNITKNMIFVGNSDATPILLAIAKKTQAKVVYGFSLLSHFGEWESYYVENSYMQLMNAIIDRIHKIKEFEYWTDDYVNWEEFSRPKHQFKTKANYEGNGRIIGKLIGGNLHSMVTAWDKRYMPTIAKNTILFLEDSHKSADMVEKLYSFLALKGVFRKVKAIILGKYEKFDDHGSGKKPLDILKEVLNNNDITKPIVSEINCGHTHPSNGLIIKAKTIIDFNNQEIFQLS